MKKQDKIIAIGGVALIIVLAIVAVALLLNIDDGDSSIVKIKPQVTEVDLKEEMVTPVAIKVESDPDNEEQVVQEQVTTQPVANENKTTEPAKRSETTIIRWQSFSVTGTNISLMRSLI